MTTETMYMEMFTTIYPVHHTANSLTQPTDCWNKRARKRKHTGVCKVHGRVYESEKHHSKARHLVEHHVLVKGQDSGQWRVPHESQRLPQHQNQSKGAVEVKTHASTSCKDDIPETDRCSSCFSALLLFTISSLGWSRFTGQRYLYLSKVIKFFKL